MEYTIIKRKCNRCKQIMQGKFSFPSTIINLTTNHGGVKRLTDFSKTSAEMHRVFYNKKLSSLGVKSTRTISNNSI